MSHDDDTHGFLHIVGQEPTSPEQLETYIEELVTLKRKHGEIAYQKRRNEIAPSVGVTKGALDTDVNKRIKAAEAAEDNEVADELFTIGMAVEELWYSSGEGFATFERDGHLEHCRLDHPR
jgi:hypothetical protein